MAIDSKAKRMSMLSFASPLAWGHHFEVDGAVDADDRAHLLHLYGGNALSAAIEFLNLRIQFGDSVLLATGALTPPSGASEVPFEISGRFVVRSIGTGSTDLMAAGRYDNGETSGLLAPTTEITAPLDSEINNTVQATVQWGTASASNIAEAQNIVITLSDPS